MFTSRAENRLFLREDNADMRLSDKGYQLGIITDEIYKRIAQKREEVEKEVYSAGNTYFNPTEENNIKLATLGSATLKDRISIKQLLKRPEMTYEKVKSMGYAPVTEDLEVQEQVEIQVKYEGYIKRDEEIRSEYEKNEAMKLPSELDYGQIGGLSTEVIEKLKKTRPQTLGQALRVSGVTPAAVASILIHIKSQKHNKRSERVLI